MRRYLAALALAGLVASAPAGAALLTVARTLGEPASRLRPGQVYTVDLGAPIAVTPGVTFELTLRFGNGETLRLGGASAIGIGVVPTDPAGVVALESSNTLEFLDAAGPLINPTAPRDWTGGPGELGGVFDAADFVASPLPISFDAMRLRSGVIAEVGAGRPATVGRLFFWFGGIDLDYVPEPATWGLMILGFGLSGWALRRQTTSTKLSSTRFAPAFSKSISSLLPSTAVTAP